MHFSNIDPIRSYALFGESQHLPDVLHCETIAARSVQHDWELAPHRHARLHQVLLVATGGGVAHFDGEQHPLTAGSLVNMPPGHVHAFRFAPGTEGWVATLADELLDEILVHVGNVRQALSCPGVLPADGLMHQTMAQVWQEFSGHRSARALVLRGLSASLLGWVARSLSDQAEAQAWPRTAEPAQPPVVRRNAAPLHSVLPNPIPRAPHAPLLQRLHALIDAHYREHWQVADYARALAVSPTHLSRVCRTATGVAASRLIEARLMREARRQLAYTPLGVASIAYALGYADPAYFTRAFTRDTGVSPRHFRAQVAGAPPPKAGG